MELDHIFLFVSNEAEARQLMDEAGLRVNYSRAHPGQGTRNLCAVLMMFYFELLWLDGSPVSAETERIGLAARGRGMVPLSASRGVDQPHWRQCPTLRPFLPNGRVIHMAVASLNTNVPFVFQSPGGIPPINRSDGLPGDRQRPALATLGFCLLQMQNPVPLQTSSKISVPWSSGRPSRLAGNSARRRRPRRSKDYLECNVRF